MNKKKFFLFIYIIFLYSCSDLNRGRVYRGDIPSAPTVNGESPATSTTVSWYWSGDSGAGVGIYQYRLNGGAWSSDTSAVVYTPGATLSNGSNILEVREKNEEGFWSDVNSHTILIKDVVTKQFLFKNTTLNFSIPDQGTDSFVIDQDTTEDSLNIVYDAGDNEFDISYTPTADYVGSDYGEITIQDGGATIVKTVAILITVADDTNPVEPDDSSYASQWGLPDITADYAWRFNTSCRDIPVGVIDTGIDYTHPELINNMWVNENEIRDNGLDDDSNGYVDDYYGWDFVADDKMPLDPHGHGTHVAGIIGAEGNNGLGIAGVCWSAKIAALRAGDASGLFALADVAEAIAYANANGIKVTNNSYGGSSATGMSVVEDEIDNARTNGYIFVVAAGNDGTDNDATPFYPSNYATSYDNVISVAAVNSSGDLASFSNYGDSSVLIETPGEAILSTLPGSTYDSWDGTSMATPFVTGAAAFIWSLDTSLDYYNGVDGVIDIIRTNVTASHATQLNWDGKLDLNAATEDVLGL